MRLEPDWFRLITSQLWQVTLLIPAAILLLRWVGRTRPHLAYGVLLVVLLKCVTPPIFTSDFGVFTWAEQRAQQFAPRVHSAALVQDPPHDSPAPASPTSTVAPQIAGSPDADAAAPSPATGDVQLLPVNNDVTELHPVTDIQPAASPTILERLFRRPGTLAAGIWLAGALVFGIWVAVSWRQVTRLCRAPLAPDSVLTLLNRIAVDLGLKHAPRLLVSEDTVMPFVVGVRRPLVLIPNSVLAAKEHHDLVMVLAHELNHVRRRDTLVGALQLLIQGIWWFHPCVWWLNREIRRYREHCCDEEVLARLDCRPQQYARCLINVLELNERGTARLGLAGMSPFEVTSQRLRNIMRSNVPFRRRMPVGAWLAAAAAAIVLLPGARGITSLEAIASIDSGVQSPLGDRAPAAPEKDKSDGRKQPPVPQLPRYTWEAGASYPYRLTIEVDHGREVETLTGTPTFTVRNVEAGRAEFAIAGDTLSSVRTTKPGREPEFDPLRFPEIPRFPRMAFPTGSWRGPHYGPYGPTVPLEHLVRIDDRGRTVSEQGQGEPLPYMLGGLGDLLVAKWPAEADAEWSETTGTEVSITHDDESNEFPIPIGYRGTEPQPESLAAEQSSVCSLTELADGGWELRRRRDLATVQQIDGEPRIALTEDATWQFGAPGDMPSRLDATAKLIVRENNVTTTFPIRIQAERLPVE
jgi:beta-lactamase regulating signal transducer with metallopeptidase domain